MRIIISGFMGKMGQAILMAAGQNGIEVIAGVDPNYNGEASVVPVYKHFEDITQPSDCVIDFSRPQSLYGILPYCKMHDCFAVIGTTGFSEEDNKYMDSYATCVPIFRSGNMSLGVNLQLQLVKKAAATLGESFEPEIVEKHHHLKVDAPSGTALMLADAISSQSPQGKKYMYGRYTKTERRKNSELGIHSVRGGTIVGEHEVYFIGTDEIIEINHKAYSKQVFALGALRAAHFMKGKQSGLYSMQDIMLENDVLSNLYVTDSQSLLCVMGLNDSRQGISDVFSVLGNAGIFVDMISQGMFAAVSFTVKAKQLYPAIAALNLLKPTHTNMTFFEYESICKLTIEGVGMASQHGIASQVFGTLNSVGVEPLIISTGETKISIGIVSEVLPKALNALADHFDL